jgi:hypothetical protein
VDGRVAVHLARGGEEEAGAVRGGALEAGSGAVAADVERLEGQLDVVDGARRGGEVEDAVQAPRDGQLGRHVRLDEREPRVPLELGDVPPGAREQVVHRHDLMAGRLEALAEVGAGAAGDEGAHGSPGGTGPGRRVAGEGGRGNARRARAGTGPDRHSCWFEETVSNPMK